MRLPTPNPKQVESFKTLYRREFDVTLSQVEAAEISTQFLQLYYLLTHAVDSIRQEE